MEKDITEVLIKFFEIAIVISNIANLEHKHCQG